MRALRNRLILCMAWIALANTPSVYAQGKSSLFSAPIVVSGGVENVPGPNGSTTTESSVLVTPLRPEIVRYNERSRFNMFYQPEFEMLMRGDKRTTWNHSAGLAYRHVVSRRAQFDIAHSFLQSADPSRVFADNLFSVPRNKFRENATAVTWTQTLSRRTSMLLRFDNTVTRISAPTPADDTHLRQVGVVGTGSLTRYLTERQKLTGAYSILKFTPYEFGSEVDAFRFLANVPTVRAGVSRFALNLALASSESSTTPTGMAQGGTIGGSTPAVPLGGILDTPLGPVTGLPVPGGISGGLPTAPLVGVVTPLPQPTSTATCVATLIVTCPTGTTVGDPLPSVPPVPTTPSLFFATSTTPVMLSLQQDGMRMLGHPFHTVTMTYAYTFSPGLLIEATGGVMGDNDPSYLAGAQVERRFDRVWVAGSVQRFLSFYGTMPVQGGVPANQTLQLSTGTRARSVFSAATVRIGGKITRRAEIEVQGSYSRSTANFAEHNIRSLIGRARLSFWFTDKFGIFATADSFFEHRASAANSDFDRQRFFGGLQFRFSTPRQAVRVAAQ